MNVFLINFEQNDLDTTPPNISVLMAELRALDGISTVSRKKDDASTMDLGQTIEIIASSGAAVAIAHGIADWLRQYRRVTFRIVKDDIAGTLTAEIQNSDAKSALELARTVLQK